MNFYDRFFAPQDIVRHNMTFSWQHYLLSMICFGIAYFVLRAHIKHQDQAFSQRLCNVLAFLMFSFEVFRISWLTYYYGWHLENIRFDWCNQVCFWLPLIVLFDAKALYPYIDLPALGGGLAVLIYPLWIFYDYGGIHVMSVQSMLSHGLMLTIALSLPFAGNYKRQLKTVYKPLIGVLCLLVTAFVMSYLLKTNYLIMRSAEGIPLISHIPWPYYWLVVLPFIVGLAYLITHFFEKWDQKWVHPRPIKALK